MPLLGKFEVYADYGTFALTPLIDGDLEFPSDVKDDDIASGFRAEGGSVIIYLPDLDSFEITAEVYRDSWPQQPCKPDMSFVTELVASGGPFKVYGLLDSSDDKTAFKVESGRYECSGRGFFSESENLFQILLNKKA